MNVTSKPNVSGPIGISGMVCIFKTGTEDNKGTSPIRLGYLALLGSPFDHFQHPRRFLDGLESWIAGS